jgi:hypothetical protein
MQCSDRWHGKLVSNIDSTTARTGKWTSDEDSKLVGAAAHGGNAWAAISALVLGRTTKNAGIDGGTLVSSIDPITARACKWTADEDSKLKKTIKLHGGKNGVVIVALV